MTFETKAFDNKSKFRCMLKLAFDPSYTYARKVEELGDAGLSPNEARVVAGPPPTSELAETLIERALSYTFDPSRAGRYVEGRFNTRDFPALYAAGEESTATAERRHHWLAGNQDAPFVIFSVSFSGSARDIRPGVASGDLRFPEGYFECQRYAREAIDAGCDAIAAPSKRANGGNCCAIFSNASVTRGRIERKGVF